MKEIDIFYTGCWTTSVEVPDDFEVTKESMIQLAKSHEEMGEFDFQDGGAFWELEAFTVGGELIEV